MAECRQISEYEEIRLKNMKDNKAILEKLMLSMQDMVRTPIKAPRHKRRCLSERNSSPVRRNPLRSCRPPSERVKARRRMSLTSSPASSSMDSSPSFGRQLIVKFGSFHKMDQNNNTNADDDSDCEGLKVYDNDDDDSNDDDVMNDDESPNATRKPQRLLHKSLPRDIRDVNAVVTEEDLKRVATYVSEKRYDSEYGSSCHQCRQKTNDMKTICRSSNCVGVRGQFCGPCLRNRYGEDAKECLKNPHWVCPPCRGICNCSFCRRRAGKVSTGILIHVAREMGFEDCNSYLQSLRKRTNPEN